MSNPFVSIIVPTYNRLNHLMELMESFRRQTFQDFEVILINDGGERVNLLKDMFPSLRISILNMLSNVKHVRARNKGVSMAKGSWILLMDDDDLLVPSHIETMVQESMGFDLLYSDAEIVKYETRNKKRYPLTRKLFAYELDLAAMRQFSTYIPFGSLYRRSLHEKIGLFEPYVHNYWDWDFFLRISA